MENYYRKFESKQDLLNFIQESSEESGDDWENISVQDFLKALASWLDDADGYYNNFNIPIDANKPSWQLFADALAAAKIYE